MSSLLVKNRTILHGDVLEQLGNIPSESIDCIITSPPYWGLRDYGVEGQWGLEKDFHEYLEHMRILMEYLKEALKPTGTCWINLGDSYSGSGKGAGSDIETVKESWRFDKKPEQQIDIEAKSRIGVPERFYIECIDAGWIARNPIVWYKANSMPCSVKDRFTNKYEMIYFFAKQQKYYFNLDAIREKTTTETKPFNVRIRDAKKGLGQLDSGLPSANRFSYSPFSL